MHVADVIKDLERKGSLRSNKGHFSINSFKEDLNSDELSDFFAHLEKRPEEPQSPQPKSASKLKTKASPKKDAAAK